MNNLFEKIIIFLKKLITEQAIIIELTIALFILNPIIRNLFTEIDSLHISIAFVVLYLLLVLLIHLIYKKRLAAQEDESMSMSSAILSTLQKLTTPVFIVSKKKGTIIWTNKSANSLVGQDKSSHGQKFADLIEIVDSDSSTGKLNVKINDRNFEVVPFNTLTSSTHIIVFELIETTKLNILQNEKEEANIVFGYISIDNLNDYSATEQQSIKDASLKIETLLLEWSYQHEAIIRGYDKDKYIFECSYKKFKELEENKFDILDKVKDITISDNIIPVTMSFGIANISDSSLVKKEEIARSALDMALQRGGDQIVVKSDKEIDFYGGRTKALAKRTKVHARSIAERIYLYIKKSSNVLIMGHKFADFDAFASCIGMAKIAEYAGVKTNIVANKNDVNIKRSLKMLNNNKHYDSLIIDSFSALDNVQNDTLLIICDCNNFKNVECPELTLSCSNNMIIIDHHRKTSEYVAEPLISYIEPSSSSASELVTEMIDFILPQNSLSINEANLLLSGIMLDTKQFNKNTGTRTFSAAQFLVEKGADSSMAQNLFKIDINDFVNEGKFRNNAAIYRDITAISVSKEEGSPEDRITSAKAADKLLTIEGIQASFALIKIGNAIHISARSDGSINVQLILEELNGGGHFDSAGAQIEGETLEGSIRLLKHAIDNYIDQNMVN